MIQDEEILVGTPSRVDSNQLLTPIFRQNDEYQLNVKHCRNGMSCDTSASTLHSETLAILIGEPHAVIGSAPSLSISQLRVELCK